MSDGVATQPRGEPEGLKRAMLYEHLPGEKVRCELCAHRCVIFPGRAGICRVRENIGGDLFTHTYGRVVARDVDPIEKKPLNHFHPGSTAYSIATVGCNFHCSFCQNWAVSQVVSPAQFLMGYDMTPEEIVDAAVMHECRSLAYTYTEPTIFMEYALDTAEIAHRRGLRNIFVTNGYETPEALEALRPYLDAANVDLKSFRDADYRKVVGARLQPVLDTIQLMKRLGIWLEVTTLVVPGYNDTDDELRDIARFLARDVGKDTPWHLSRFFPAYRMADVPRTEVSRLETAREIGLEEGLEYVYVGNVRDTAWENTYCPGCDALLIERRAMSVISNRMQDGCCFRCGMEIAGVGLDWQQREASASERTPSVL